MGEEKEGSEHGRCGGSRMRGLCAAVSLLVVAPAVRRALERRREHKRHGLHGLHGRIHFDRKPRHFASHGH